MYNRLGIAFRRQKKFDEAIKYYEKALIIDPEEEYLLFNLARAYIGAGNMEQARLSLNRALKINSNFTEARELLLKIQS